MDYERRVLLLTVVCTVREDKMPKSSTRGDPMALLKARILEEKDNPALIQACRKGSLEEVESLLVAGANVDCVDSTKRQTALMMAVKNRNVDIVKVLLKGGADVNFDTDHGTALNTAVRGGSPQLCQILLESGASPPTKIVEKWYIPYCCKRSFFGVVKVLLDFLATKGNILYKKTTLMILAATHGHFELVRVLVERGGVNFERQGERALIATCAGGDFSKDDYIAIIKLLMRQNLDVNYFNEMGKTAIYEAALNSRGGEKVVKLLLDNGALFEVDTLVDVCDPECFGRFLCSPLAGAVKHGYIDRVRLLLDLGADVNEIWRRDVNPSATKLGSGGTDISMLMLACKNKTLISVAKELLDRGADVNMRNSAGNTALHIAVHSDFRTWASKAKAPSGSYFDRHYNVSPRAQPDTILLLLLHGSSVAAKNQDGETPFDICMKMISSSNNWHFENESLIALSFLIKADSKNFDSQDVSWLCDIVKRRRYNMDVEIMEELVRILIAAGVKPTPQLIQMSDHDSHDPLQRKVFALLNHCSKNPTSLQDQCRTRVRASLRSPLNDVNNVSLGLSVPLRRFIIMDDLELFVRGHPKLQVLNISSCDNPTRK
ncbi:ankyrin repeat and KH domain-containing protein 1-like [Lineus longissimus]|uniref:ankyrin repeat and KH domain-containing protein 1-like n=1 Tax=Lineus longissimus TaxID=88925 RepID=UPI002B4DD6B3